MANRNDDLTTTSLTIDNRPYTVELFRVCDNELLIHVTCDFTCRVYEAKLHTEAIEQITCAAGFKRTVEQFYKICVAALTTPTQTGTIQLTGAQKQGALVLYICFDFLVVNVEHCRFQIDCPEIEQSYNQRIERMMIAFESRRPTPVEEHPLVKAYVEQQVEMTKTIKDLQKMLNDANNALVNVREQVLKLESKVSTLVPAAAPAPAPAPAPVEAPAPAPAPVAAPAPVEAPAPEQQ